MDDDPMDVDGEAPGEDDDPMDVDGDVFERSW